MGGIKNGTLVGKNADFTQVDGPNSSSSESNGLVLDGRLWIGSTAVNAGGTHINVGTLTSPNSSVTIGFSSPNITLSAGGAVATTYQADSGSATPAANILNVLGGTGIDTSGSGSTVTIAVDGAVVGQTITGDSGGALSPTAGNWNILGQQAGTVAVVDTVGTAPSTLRVEDRTWVSQFVVDPSATVGLRGTFSTIQAAITAAVSGQIIYIRPGTYTENLTLKSGVNLFGFDSDLSTTSSVNIVGNATLTSGTVNIEGICLRANGAAAVLTVSGTADVNLCNCFIIGGGAAAFVGDSGGFHLFQCNFQGSGATSVLFSCINASTVQVVGCNLITAATSPSTFANSTSVTITNSIFQNHITTSDTAQFVAYNSSFGFSAGTSKPYTFNGTGTSNFAYNCSFESGTATAITIGTGVTFQLSGVTIRSSNAVAIAGAGTLQYSGIDFIGTSSSITTTTQTPFVTSNDAIKVVTPGAYPYTTVPQDGIILVDTSSARTITPLASPTTGQRHIIKDSVGSAAANNITVTPSGKNIDGAASSVINIAYGSITIIYNGTEWSLV